MHNKITKSLKLAVAGLAILFAAGNAQAAPMPTPDFDFGLLGVGTQSRTGDMLDLDPNVLWFQFEIGATSLVDLTTIGSQADTELGLYDSTGSLLNQNDDCPGTGSLYSCLQFPSLAAGTYIAGVAVFNSLFDDDWELPQYAASQAEVTLSVTARALSAVPVPAAVWLFGSALIGFVGMARKTSVRS